MKVTFLGTGTSQGIPVIGSDHPVCLSDNPKDKRLRVSVMLEWEGHTYVIDCGPDFRQQMLQARCTKIDGILFTHEHADHTSGLDDIRPFYYKQGPVPIYAHNRVISQLKDRFFYLFDSDNGYLGASGVVVNPIENNPFCIANKTVIPINGTHYNLQVFGFRIDNFAYLTDMKTIANDEIEKLKGVEVLVVNALRETAHPAHFNLAEALALIDKVKPKKAYLTHISHMLGFHDEVEARLPEHIHLAYDNLKIQI
ncbi:beta-lactamase [Mangrovimonas yunxiaonensis]|uniref:Beta-lactamase n=1 Tax=Mangrovimonas yunxiaonensis TaxID=1197477 RepID=A0A084THW4_9FLAO|nr:MBL fold metallo-hydrolase [Mangrovimonas yunxiaonensis]KFB00300.1 beta-lactamase [Mangrovimonas yunxiaonensis]GGH41576.1 MBL fold metallo-hydrolase [Mangrovimonas yunxiaonensis]